MVVLLAPHASALTRSGQTGIVLATLHHVHLGTLPFPGASSWALGMRRKPLLLALTILLIILGVGAGLILLVTHEPEFYTRAAMPPGTERKQRSGRFVQEFF